MLTVVLREVRQQQQQQQWFEIRIGGHNKSTAIRILGVQYIRCLLDFQDQVSLPISVQKKTCPFL